VTAHPSARAARPAGRIRAAASLALAASLLSGPVRADDQPRPPAPSTPVAASGWRGSGELVVGGLVGTLHGVGVSGLAFRVGLGGHQPGGWPGREDSDLAVLVTAGGLVGESSAGLKATGRRLGLGTRARLGRLLLGADLELVQLDFERRSTSGRLRGTGVGGRLLAGLQLVQLGPAALFLTLEGQLDELAPITSKIFVPAGQLGLGARW
jgi:hypothetical protein